VEKGKTTYWSGFDLGHFREVLLIIDAVAENVSKGPQCPLQSICCALLLGFLESGGFALAVFYMAVSNVLEAS
jgi:hypothetical protein